MGNQAQKEKKRTALIGWSIASIEAIDNLKRSFVVVGPPNCASYAQKYEIPFVGWDFEAFKDTPMEKVYEQSQELYETLRDEHNVEFAIPLFEDTVEWAGALNAYFQQDPKVFHHSLLFRHKGRMKRRAQLGGLKIGIFEEADSKDDVRQFLKRVNEALLKLEEDEHDPIHLKAFDKAGDVGHRVIHKQDDIDNKLSDYTFPCLMESHLDGIEISCEVFIHKGKIQFLNVTEYVVFGYSMMAPPSPIIEEKRPKIRKTIEQLIDVFDIKCGFIHPEFFITEEGILNFVEVAYRVPGGSIFELIKKAYNFNPYQGHILCCDPNTTEEELRDFFPDEQQANGHAGSLMVYANVKHIQGLNIPEELEKLPSFDKHNMFTPTARKVQKSEGFGTPDGLVFFHHEDSEHVRQPLMEYANHDFYV